ncbi:MAG: cupin domain-containing protein [Planctomycetales bacterium]|nr:cupin domain-containing protein [Planctomycetales bacterium]
MGNVYAGIPVDLPSELMETLLETKEFRVERIVSRGHASPVGFWYDQDESEWVLVLRGRARLLFEGDDQPMEMGPGDFVDIPSHRKHRVEWTSPEEATVWLAIHYC